MIMKYEYLDELKERIQNTDPAIFSTIGMTAKKILEDESIMECLWTFYQKSIEDYDCDADFAYQDALKENLKIHVENATPVKNNSPIVKLLLICPSCGGNAFIRTGQEDFEFKCSACGCPANVEDMTTDAIAIA